MPASSSSSRKPVGFIGNKSQKCPFSAPHFSQNEECSPWLAKPSGNWPHYLSVLAPSPCSLFILLSQQLPGPPSRPCPGLRSWHLASPLPAASLLEDAPLPTLPFHSAFCPRVRFSHTIPAVPPSCLICLQSSHGYMAYFRNRC